MHSVASLGIHGAPTAPGMHMCTGQPSQLLSVHAACYSSMPISLSPCLLPTGGFPLLTHMFSFPIALHLPNMNSKIKWLRISRQNSKALNQTQASPKSRAMWLHGSHTHEAGWPQGLTKKLPPRRSRVREYVYTQYFHNRVSGKLEHQRPVGRCLLPRKS